MPNDDLIEPLGCTVPRAFFGLMVGLVALMPVMISLSHPWHGSAIINPSADMGQRLLLGFYSDYRVNKGVALICGFTSTLGGMAATIFYTMCVEHHWDNNIGQPLPPVGRVSATLHDALPWSQRIFRQADE